MKHSVEEGDEDVTLRQINAQFTKSKDDDHSFEKTRVNLNRFERIINN